MVKIFAILLIAASLSACDLLYNGYQNTKAVENDLEKSIGMRPTVGFRWHNGRFEYVNVTFPSLYQAKPVGELADIVRDTVSRHFKDTPNEIVLAFSIGKATPRTTAQIDMH